MPGPVTCRGLSGEQDTHGHFSQNAHSPLEGTDKQEVTTMAPGGNESVHKTSPGDPMLAVSLRQGSRQEVTLELRPEGRPGWTVGRGWARSQELPRRR